MWGRSLSRVNTRVNPCKSSRDTVIHTRAYTGYRFFGEGMGDGTGGITV
jgi:hypothetical protein